MNDENNDDNYWADQLEEKLVSHGVFAMIYTNELIQNVMFLLIPHGAIFAIGVTQNK